MFARSLPLLLVVTMAPQITPLPPARSDQYQLQAIPPGDITNCRVLEGQANIGGDDSSPTILLPCTPQGSVSRDR